MLFYRNERLYVCCRRTEAKLDERIIFEFLALENEFRECKDDTRKRMFGQGVHLYDKRGRKRKVYFRCLRVVCVGMCVCVCFFFQVGRGALEFRGYYSSGRAVRRLRSAFFFLLRAIYCSFPKPVRKWISFYLASTHKGTTTNELFRFHSISVLRSNGVGCREHQYGNRMAGNATAIPEILPAFYLYNIECTQQLLSSFPSSVSIGAGSFSKQSFVFCNLDRILVFYTVQVKSRFFSHWYTGARAGSVGVSAALKSKSFSRTFQGRPETPVSIRGVESPGV